MIRRAHFDDLDALLEMERAASTASFAHIFPAHLPFPADDVLARWAVRLDDPTQTVLIAEMAGERAGYVAVGGGWLNHLGVVPDHWGSGLADVLHDAALAALAAEGADTSYLWVLVDNHRARRFYRRRGWRETDFVEAEVFEPFPLKLQMWRAMRPTGDGGLPALAAPGP